MPLARSTRTNDRLCTPQHFPFPFVYAMELDPSFAIPMIYDLSQPVFHDAPQWATYPSITVTLEYKIATDGFNAEHVKLTTHSGTHIDAPFHFIPNAESVSDLPLEHFVAPAIALDFRSKTPKSNINAADLHKLLAERDVRGHIVLLNTGWGEKRNFTKEYLEQYPYLSGDGAEFLVAKGIKGVGTDCLSIGGFEDGQGPPAHNALLGNKKLIVEDLRIPETLLDGKIRWFAAFPIRLKGASAGWTRAIAWDEGEFSAPL